MTRCPVIDIYFLRVSSLVFDVRWDVGLNVPASANFNSPLIIPINSSLACVSAPSHIGSFAVIPCLGRHEVRLLEWTADQGVYYSEVER